VGHKNARYNYDIIYKKGNEKMGVDSLSRKYEEEVSLFSLSLPILDWIDEVCQEWLVDSKIVQHLH